ncbi:MAG: hypothetical protein M3Y12_02975 [Bacteroidota bacterium]|nr:hypothetical protein [Bacteroidota bacterium]
MQPHILTIPDDTVYEQLVQLAAAAGLHIAADGLVSKPEIPKRSREELLAIIRRGGDGLSIPDPLAWQREQRDDSNLPFYALGKAAE